MSHSQTLPARPDTPIAWLVVLASFIVGFVVFGILYSFGAFFDSMIAEFDASRTAASGGRSADCG